LIDSDFYVAGGEGGAWGSISQVWKYHIPNDSWTQVGNLPFGGAGSQCTFVLNGKGYFLASRDSINNNNCDTMFWEYDPVGDIWNIRAGFPGAPRQNCSYFTSNGKGYVGQTYGCGFADTYFWEYDPILDNWTQITTLPSNITAGSVTISTLSTDAYLFGGYDQNGNLLKDVWKYNIMGNQWDSIGQMPGLGRCYSVFWGFDSVIIGGGGETSDNDTIFKLGNDFYLYNIFLNLWRPVVFQNSFDSAGAGITFVYNNKGYYFGGYTSITTSLIFNNNMWSFDASRFFPTDTSTGIASVRADVTFSLYPNPVGHGQGFSISTSESGSIVFYDALGQLLDERKLVRGMNTVRLSTAAEVVFYRATLQDGRTENGKVVTSP